MTIKDVPASLFGTFLPTKTAGDNVKATDVIGTLDGFTVYAMWDGVIYSIAPTGEMYRGDLLASIETTVIPQGSYFILSSRTGWFIPKPGLLDGDTVQDGDDIGKVGPAPQYADYGGVITFIAGTNGTERIGSYNVLARIDRSPTKAPVDVIV